MFSSTQIVIQAVVFWPVLQFLRVNEAMREVLEGLAMSQKTGIRRESSRLLLLHRLFPVLEIGIPQRNVGIDGCLFESLIITDLEGCFVYGFNDKDHRRHSKGDLRETEKTERVKNTISNVSNGIARRGRAYHGPYKIKTMAYPIITKGLAKIGRRFLDMEEILGCIGKATKASGGIEYKPDEFISGGFHL